jgi:hypothetical protein
MANDLVVVNNRRAVTVSVAPHVLDYEQKYIDRANSRRGWVMVPGLNYSRKIENVVADQFDRMADSLESKRLFVSEHLLDMIGMMKRMIIEDIQAAACRWGKDEAKLSRFAEPNEIITRAGAADEALQIIRDHFSILHEGITDFQLVDLTDQKQKLIILELHNLEAYTRRYVLILIMSWV